MKKQYQAPEVVEFGNVAELTAALGPSATPDQSEYPDMPASTGSYDICDNDDHSGVC